MSSVNIGNFTSTFATQMLFFSCLIFLTRTSSIMLNRNGEISHLVLILGENFSVLHHGL